MNNSNTPNVDVVMERMFDEMDDILESANRLIVISELLNDPEYDKWRVLQELGSEYPSVIAELREIVERSEVSYQYLQNLQKDKVPRNLDAVG